ncbi:MULTISPECIES: hypothetical protein [unclassified Actinoplanes]|uniref:hypothetical protein n=1 Tax=unclassified Actinoplanes TaxID=2626549 RepID=UPI000316A35A|nr:MULTISPECIES: hypothetical protein [unclassified Actinoplanes]
MGEVRVPFHCGTATVSEAVRDGRLLWDVHHRCPDGDQVSCGRDGLPDELRQAVLAQGGRFRVGFPEADRLAVLRVLRRRGVAIGSLDGVRQRGVTGTEAEMELLRQQLAAVGVVVVVERCG